MPSPEIEEFARILIQQVRDTAIRSNDCVLRPDVRHAIAERWRKAASSGGLEPIAKVLIPDVVDDTLFYLFRAIDEGFLKISYTASNGQTVNLNSAGGGELSGWIANRGAWIAQYSKERFVDNCAGLELE